MVTHRALHRQGARRPFHDGAWKNLADAGFLERVCWIRDGAQVAIAFHGWIAVHIQGDPARLTGARPIPAGGSYLGQPARELAQRMGNPRERIQYSGGFIELEYTADLTVILCEGRVCGITGEGR